MIRSLLLLSILFIHSFASANFNEDCFSRSFSDPQELYLQAYHESGLLGWGFTSHADHRPIRELGLFLDKIGLDENLKYIFVEQPVEAKQWIEEIAEFGAIQSETTFDLPFMDKIKEVLSSEVEIYNQPLSFESIYVYKKVFELNKKRKNKIIVTTVDAYSLKNEIEGKRHLGLSLNREQESSQSFLEYYKNMSSTDKAIFLSHAYHLSRNVDGLTPFYKDGLDYDGVKGPSTFMNLSPVNHSINLIVFDSHAQLRGFDNRLFNSPFTLDSPENDKKFAFLEVSKNSDENQCLGENNFMDRYIYNLEYKKGIAGTFQYLIYMSSK